MTSVESVIAALNAFEAEPHDFHNESRLYEILSGFRELNNRIRVVPAIFGLIERYPEADFGSPGPLVHEVEAIKEVQPFLRESLHRKPTALTVWMVNRILNSSLSPAERMAWISELRLSSTHESASESAKHKAIGFLEYQAKRGVEPAVPADRR